MEDIISQTKAELVLFKSRLIKDLAETPDDRINWSPSPSARTPLQLVAHVAMSTKGLQGMCQGHTTVDFSNIAAVDAGWREAEKQYTTRESVVTLLDENTTAYIAFLDSLTPEQVASEIEIPFMGPQPLAEAITWAADHTRAHTAQLEYLQTIYGDLNWHM